MSRRRVLHLALIALACSFIAGLLHLLAPASYRDLEHRVRDSLARLGRKAPVSPELVFLAIDSASVRLDPELDVNGLYASSAAEDLEAHRALELMSKGWPWNREIYSLIVDRLISAGAAVVVLDFLFPSPGEGDASFQAALERFGSQVVIGSDFVSPGGQPISAILPSSYHAPSRTLIPAATMPDHRVGFTNFFTGPEATVRAVHYRVAFGERDGALQEHLSLAARAMEKAGRQGAVPPDFGAHLIRFAGPAGSFRPRSVFEIFVPEYWEQNYGSGEFFRGKIVLLGAEGRWQKDELRTPFGSMPGAEVHLHAINALWHQEFLRDLPAAGNLALIVACAAVGVGLCLLIVSPWRRLLALAAAGVGAAALALAVYNVAGVYLPLLAPLLAMISTVLLGLALDFAVAQLDKTRLRATLQAREDMTQMIVHDLRSPLTVVSGYMEALERMAAGRLNAKEAQFIAEARRGAGIMRDMITTLLDVGRLEAGEMPLRIEPVEFGELARTAARRLAPAARTKVVHCEVTAKTGPIQCDADVVRRVMENLLTNAIKYARTTIWVQIDECGDAILLEVRDDGEGIPREQHARIFEKFGQVDGGGKHRHSTGLGLAFCRLAVEAHGGEIGVRSEVGIGSTFWFKLPKDRVVRNGSVSSKVLARQAV
jgi:signal transduction histidine kinase